MRTTSRLVIALVLLGVVVAGFTTPGVFTIDEPHHIVSLASLRDGTFHLRNTEGLPAAKQLFFFMPGLAPEASPATSTVPPLYAFFAWPLSWLGFRGLFLLNTLSYLATIAMVFSYARRYAKRRRTPWLAAGAFAFGGYALEYALAVWPHMLSVALVVAAALLADRARRSSRPTLVVLLAGLSVGLAAGVRYQNVIVAAAIGLALLLWARRRVVAVSAFAVGCALPLSASAAINWTRLGTANPISKGSRYFTFDGAGRQSHALDLLRSFWMRTVDYSARPAGKHLGGELWPEPGSGAYVVFGEVKKALLQSAPWIALVLVATLLAWRSRPLRTQREIRAVSIIIWAMLLGFAATGLTRTDGVCYNQRYFHELVPFAALALAWAIERTSWKGDGFVVSAAIGAGMAALVCWGIASPVREILIIRAPLVLGSLLLLVWLLRKRSPKSRSLGVMLGLCLGWAFGVHMADIKASTSRRELQASVTVSARQLLPADQPYAVFGSLAVTHALAPLLLEHDAVILDSARGGPKGTRALLKELFARRRRVFVVANNSGGGFLRFVTRDRPVREQRAGQMVVLELGCSPAWGECSR